MTTNIIYSTQFQIETTDLIDDYNIKDKFILCFKYVNFTLDEKINADIYYKIQKGLVLFELTSTDYFKKNMNINITSIYLGKCEDILKDAYNISYNTTLYLLIIDINEQGMKIPKIEYEVYHIIDEDNLIQLNLTLCKNERIELSIPVDIDDNIDKYNSSSGYYNDFCYRITSNYGTDICLKDRREEFINNNLTLCEENCNLIDYDYIYRKAKCSCEIKINIPLLEDIKFDKEKLKKNFIDINNILNYKFLKCYKIVFKKKNLILNYGFYILTFIYALFFLCFFLFYFKYYNLFFEKIKKLISDLKKDNKIEYIKTNNKNITNSNQFININKNNENNINELKKIKDKKLLFGNKQNKSLNTKIIHNKKEIHDKSKNKNKSFNILNKTKNNNNTNNKNKNKNDVQNYTDSELNSLPYEEALKHDKRTFIQYYLSLLKIKHSLLFSFYPNKDYNSQIIKMFLFFFSFASQLSINALFFSDETMHQIYEDKGSFNFIYQIPQIIYSSLLSMMINNIIKFFSLSEKNITDFKEEKKKDSKNIDKKINKLYIKLKIKFALFFIITPVILFSFWFYTICFCGVYKNTQIHLIKDTLFSLLMFLIYPFGTSILPGIFRQLALKAKNKDRNLLNKFSQLLENI